MSSVETKLFQIKTKYLMLFDTGNTTTNSPTNNNIAEPQNEIVKVEPNTTVTKLIEKYTNAISESSTLEQNKMYQEKLDSVIKNKHLIEVVEGIIKAKGINNICIIPNENKINIIVETEKTLTDAQVNLIEQIVKEEFNVDMDNIKIVENN